MKKILLLMLCLILLLTACGKGTSQTEDPQPEPINYAAAPMNDILTSMTLEEKVAQMFIARCPSVDASIYAQQYQLGGYILFGPDFEESDPDTFRETIKSYHDSVKIPMFIAVDEEGGLVTRASRYPQFRETPFQSPQELYAEGGLDRVREDAKEKSQFLLDLGINVNFAPVCDVTQQEEAFMYERAVALDAQGTAEYTRTVVEEMTAASMGSVLKHFPGYGDNGDTHTDIVRDKRPIETFEESDFLPFKAGIDAGAEIVLVSHSIVECMDKEMPASLSPEINRILREDLGFDGLVITDDLVMEAIGKYTDNESAAVQAVLAGNDLLCCTDFTVQIPAVIEAVKNGTISEDQIDASVKKIIEYKRKLGIIK